VDVNKLRVLQGLPYRISPVCGLCEYGSFPKDDWGSCDLHTYEHLKHSEAHRQVSIHKYGGCPSFKLDASKASLLGFFKQFLANTGL
jgi:hypothetical protein